MSLSDRQIKVTVWNENIHERTHQRVRDIYPEGIHGAVAAGIRENLGNLALVRTGTLELPEHGLTQEVLDNTDVLTWWGHAGHHLVDDVVVSRIYQRVIEGMGLVVLHSGHWSKIFTKLMGTRCTLHWREADDREVVWTVNPSHPITKGVPPAFVVPAQEMYGEFFDIPVPDELIFISSFSGGEVFRSGCCFRRGKGKIFYFSPGHETYPVYHQREVRRVIANGVLWVYEPAPAQIDMSTCVHAPNEWFADSTVEVGTLAANVLED